MQYPEYPGFTQIPGVYYECDICHSVIAHRGQRSHIYRCSMINIIPTVIKDELKLKRKYNKAKRRYSEISDISKKLDSENKDLTELCVDQAYDSRHLRRSNYDLRKEIQDLKRQKLDPTENWEGFLDPKFPVDIDSETQFLEEDVTESK